MIEFEVRARNLARTATIGGWSPERSALARSLGEPPVGCRHATGPNLQSDPPKVFAAAVRFALPPVRTAARAGADIDAVRVSRFGLDVVDATGPPKRNRHRLCSGSLRSPGRRYI
jgi:hypothetical protein